MQSFIFREFQVHPQEKKPRIPFLSINCEAILNFESRKIIDLKTPCFFQQTNKGSLFTKDFFRVYKKKRISLHAFQSGRYRTRKQRRECQHREQLFQLDHGLVGKFDR